MRARLLDLAVTTVCVACIAAPVLPIVYAAGSSSNPVVQESGGTVDQKVLEGGVISNPLNGSFDTGRSGVVNGSLQWDVYTTARDGIKLLVSTDRSPAMRDPQNGIDVDDLGDTPAAWSVAAADRRFGFTAAGELSLERFSSGTLWRGFSGTRSVEVGRRGTATARTRTTVKLRAEFGTAIPSDGRPAATVVATAVPNL